MSSSQSAAPEAGTLKRSLQMKMFASPDQIEKVSIASVQMKNGKTPPEDEREIPVGQLVGEIMAVEVRDSVLPDGEVKESWIAIGEFEASVYHNGKVFSANAAYLPTYVLRTAKTILDKGKSTVELAVEIYVVATGKTVPYAYEVKSLVNRPRGNAIDRLKAQMATAGRLRGLAPPPAETLIEGQIDMLTNTADVAGEAARGEVIEGEVIEFDPALEAGGGVVDPSALKAGKAKARTHA